MSAPTAENQASANEGVPRGGARWWPWLVLGVCAFGCLLRVLNAAANLSSPHVDENAIADQAVAFMGGEWRYYLPEYGPLPMYLLAAVYHLVALARGLTPLDYASRVFFDQEQQYFIARLLGVSSFALLAIASYRVLAPRFGRWAAGTSSMLLALPGLDQLTYAKARVDVPQGALQVGALLALIVAMESRKLRYWLLAGACAGCGIACKPMPGLLVLPCFLAASWFAAEVGAPGSSPENARGVAGGLRCFGRRLFEALRRPGLWGSALTTLLAELACNPTSFDVKAFIAGQREAVSFYSGSRAPGDHLDVFQNLLPLGWAFLAAAVFCLCLMPFLGDARARLIALFPLVYVTAFWGRPMRAYYLVAPAMASCLVIGIGIGILLERSGRLRAALPHHLERGFAALLSLCTVTALAWAPAWQLDSARRSLSPVTQAREWIIANVPSGTKIYHLGAFGWGPRLVSTNAKQQAKFADYFEYGREHYEFFNAAYRLAYERYVADQRPRYVIESTKRRAHSLASGKTSPAWLVNSLDARARKAGQEYILVCQFGEVSDVLELNYPWFKSVDLVQRFGRIAIFHVRPEGAEPAAPKAEAPIRAADAVGDPGAEEAPGTDGPG